MLASRHIKREKGSLPVDVRPSKTSLLKLPNMKMTLGSIGHFHKNTINPRIVVVQSNDKIVQIA